MARLYFCANVLFFNLFWGTSRFNCDVHTAWDRPKRVEASKQVESRKVVECKILNQRACPKGCLNMTSSRKGKRSPKNVFLQNSLWQFTFAFSRIFVSSWLWEIILIFDVRGVFLVLFRDHGSALSPQKYGIRAPVRQKDILIKRSYADSYHAKNLENPSNINWNI